MTYFHISSFLHDFKDFHSPLTYNWLTGKLLKERYRKLKTNKLQLKIVKRRRNT